jgi:DNA-binding NarL/FixJ family response regulator
MRTAAVVDEWALVRAGVELAMRQHGVGVTWSGSTASELFSRVGGTETDERPIDVVVIGQVSDATQVATVRRAAVMGIPVIALSASALPSALIELCAEGALGVVGRDSHDGELSAALESLLAGRRYVAPGLLSAMFDARVEVPRRARFDLTYREREVLTEVASGRSNDEISERLLIGTQTVKTHLNNIYDKLGVRRRTHAVHLALSQGLV